MKEKKKREERWVNNYQRYEGNNWNEKYKIVFSIILYIAPVVE